MTADWLSALAAAFALLFGVPSLLMTIRQLVQRDDAQDRMITQLAAQVQELAKQTQEFERQTGIMAQSLKAYESMLEISTKELMLNEQAAAVSLQKQEADRLKRIQPLFHLVSAGLDEEYLYRILLTNIGKMASQVVVRHGASTSPITLYVDLLDAESGKEKVTGLKAGDAFSIATQIVRLDIWIDRYSARGRAENAEFEVILEFEDAAGNSYTQMLRKQAEGSCILDQEATLLPTN